MTTYSVKRGDTLSRIANRFTRASRSWRREPHREPAPDSRRAEAPGRLVRSAEGEAAPGVEVRFDGKAKVMTLHVHKFVPASKVRTEGKNSTESFAALKDMADFIKRENPDVVVLQELDNDVSGREAKHGVNKQLDRLAALVGATGKAMASWRHMKGGNGYDNAIITRNGFKVDENVSVKLPVSGKARTTTRAAWASPM